MEIVLKKPNELKPYPNNPRRNDQAVAAVANSIKEFGFKVPIVIDKDGVIIAGHTRLKAAELLGLDQVPCIVADDLTPEQIKAFRIADNSVAALADWDMGLLKVELDDILNIDMELFGIEFEKDLPNLVDDDEDDGYYGDERERTGNAYNLGAFDPDRAAGKFQIPSLEPCYYVPEDLQGFNYVLNKPDMSKGVHFFIDDYQFERVWSRPEFYIEKLKDFPCVLTPDFSLYMDMPMAMKIWNVYRSRLFGQMCQDAGIRVIPTLSWAEPATFDFCFDGIPERSVVAVSTVGVLRDEKAKNIWRIGMEAALDKLQPRAVVLYGEEIDYDFGRTLVKPIAVRKGW